MAKSEPSDWDKIDDLFGTETPGGMATDDRCLSRDDQHQCMGIRRFAKEIGFSGHIQAIGEKYQSPDPRADWSAFLEKEFRDPPVTLSRWPTLFRQFVKKKSAKSR